MRHSFDTADEQVIEAIRRKLPADKAEVAVQQYLDYCQSNDADLARAIADSIEEEAE